MYFRVLLILFCCCLLRKATTQTVDTRKVRSEIRINFSVVVDGTSDMFRVVLTDAQKADSISITELKFDRGDLVFELGLRDLARQAVLTDKQILADVLLYRLAQRDIPLIQQSQQAPFLQIKGNPFKYNWRLPAIAERVRPFEGQFQLVIVLHITGGLPDLSVAPMMAPWEKDLYWAGLGLGLTAVTTSFFLQTEADRTYSTYLQSLSESEAQPLYEQANRQRRAYQFTRFGGILVVLADGLAFALRKRQLKRQKDKYDYWKNYQSFHSPRLSFRPKLTLPANATSSFVGLTLRWQIAN